MEGTFVKWSTTEWELTKMKLTFLNHDQICRVQSKTLIFPGLRSFKGAKQLCRQFHGSVVVIKNKTQSDYLNDQWWRMFPGWTVSPFGQFFIDYKWLDKRHRLLMHSLQQYTRIAQQVVIDQQCIVTNHQLQVHSQKPWPIIAYQLAIAMSA